MDCDLSVENLPVPIFGDILLTNNFSSSQLLLKKWKIDFKKIDYWGNLTLLNINKDKNTKSDLIRWCFFTSSKYAEDQIVLKHLNQNIEMRT